MNNSIKSKILVIEDSPTQAEELNYILSQNGYDVFIVNNGSNAFSFLDKTIPSIILSDIVLPGMSGFEICSKLKESPETKDIPIIFLSSKTDTGDIVKGFEYGAIDYMTKPFKTEELMARIQTQTMLYKVKKELEETNRKLVLRNLEIENDLETARLLQLHLLPQKKLDKTGYDSHFTYIPMELVGGDFYDYEIRDNLIDVFIADVSGHGLTAAFFATITKIAFENIKVRTSTDGVLRHINEVMCKHSVMSNYLTSFFCTIDTAENVMRFSNSGHLPQYLYRRTDDTIIELKPPGKPLGLFTDTGLVEKEISLIRGDRIVLFTDGITECRGLNNELWGEDLFIVFIKANRSLSPVQFSEKLIEELKNFSGTEKFEDDLTLGVIDVL